MANFTRKHYKAIAEVIMQAEPRLCSRTLEHNLATLGGDYRMNQAYDGGRYGE